MQGRGLADAISKDYEMYIELQAPERPVCFLRIDIPSDAASPTLYLRPYLLFGVSNLVWLKAICLSTYFYKVISLRPIT